MAKTKGKKAATGAPSAPSRVMCKMRNQTSGSATLDRRLVDRYIRGALQRRQIVFPHRLEHRPPACL